MSYRIVVFFAEDPERGEQTIPGDLRGPEQIELLIRSARQFDPAVGLTILTTAETDLAAVREPYDRVNGTVDFGRIMRERTRMQRAFVDSYDFSSPLALLDSDMLVTGDLGAVFDGDFDVGLTFRGWDEMPVNGGVILLNDKRPEVSRRFLAAIEARYEATWTTHDLWYGDQHALRDLVGMKPEEMQDGLDVERDGMTVRLLSCETFNYTPTARAFWLFDRADRRVIYHFKGNKRRYMEPYWRYQVDVKRSRSPWRFAEMTGLTLRFVAEKSRYRRNFEADLRRFNCNAQGDQSWRDRGEVAAAMLKAALGDGQERLRIADVGCGDQKLAGQLAATGLRFDYLPLDLVPQAANVMPYDLARQELPAKVDVAIVMGVLEYLDDVDGALRRLYRAADRLLVSQVATDLTPLPDSARKKLNWVTVVTRDVFRSKLEAAGYGVEAQRVTANGKTAVWLCRRRPAAAPQPPEAL